MAFMEALGRTRTAGGTRRRAATARGTGISPAARWFHLLGAIAMIVGMFLPLTDVGQALANPGSYENQPNALAQEAPATTAFTQVAAVGDFQGQFGCGGFDVYCPATQLTNHDGLWTGSFAIPPGTWQWQVIALTQDGQQYAFDSRGQSTQPDNLTIGDGDAGAYFAFDATTQEASASAVPAIVELVVGPDTYAMSPDNGAFTAIIQAPQDGQVNAEVQVNGVASGIPLTIPVEEGPNGVTVDPAGALLNVESLGFATLTITRIDEATDQPVAGGCYEVLRNNETVNRGCDTDDGVPDGAITLSFPTGFEPGPATIREVSAPDGVDTAPEQDVDLQFGANTVEIRTGAPAEEVTEEVTGEATEEGGIVGLPTQGEEGQPTATTEPTAAPVPGDLYVTLQDESGERIGGACFELVDESGNVVGQTCDSEDTIPFNAVVGFTGIPEGDYTLRQTSAPEGTETAPEQSVTIVGGIENTATVTASRAEPTPVPTGDIVVLRGDDQGGVAGGACFQLIDGTGNPVGEPVCDDDGDVPDDGRIGFFDIPVGTYTLRETRTPEGVQPAADTPVTVEADRAVEAPVRSARIVVPTATLEPTATLDPTPEPTATLETTATLEPTATTTATAAATEEATGEAVPGSLIITLHDQDDQPIGGACFELRQGDTVIGPICDSDDPFPGNGNTGFFNQPSGTYTLAQTTVPDGTRPVPEQEVQIPAGEQQTIIVQASAPEATEAPTPTPTAAPGEEPADEGDEAVQRIGPASVPSGTGSLVVDVTGLSLDGAVVCVELNTGGGIGFLDAPSACDNGEGDENPDPGVIRMDGIAPGTYQLSFIDGPQNLVDSEPREVEILDGEVAEVRVGQELVGPLAVDPATVNVVFQTADGTRVDVEGGCATLDGVTSVCDNDGSDGDTAAGVISFGDLDPGNHTITVTEAPDGYTAATTQFTASVGAGQTQDFAVTVERITTTATVRTVDAADTTVLLPGACYTIDGANETCDDADGTNDGIVTFTGVVPGEHTVAQTVAPAGYDRVTEPVTQTVAADGSPVFEFRNTTQVGSLVITTRVAGGGDLLTGACYTLDDGAEVCDAADGADDGIVTITDVSVGLHTLIQTTAPAGYEQAAAITGLNVVAGENPVTVENVPLTGSIITEVVDEAGNPLGGACVTIEGVGDRCDGGTEDAAPDIAGTIRTNGVSLGEHDVTVASVPAGYDVPDDLQLANVTVETPATVRFTVLETPPATGGLNVRVQFADDDALIPDICVTATSSVEGVAPVSACDGGEGDTNPEAGIIGFADLQVGTWLVSLQDGTTIEGGDVANTVPASVDIIADSDQPSLATLEVPRVPTTGTLRIVTTNGTATIAGAAYRITGDGYDVTVTDDDGTDTDETDGVIQVSDLAPGAYVIAMTTAPAGFNPAGQQDATITAGESTTVEVVLTATPEPGSLAVRTLNEDDEPLANACYGLNQGGVRIIEACDGDDGTSDGTTTFAELDAGTYQLVQIRTPGPQYAAATGQDVTIEADEETVVEIRMLERPGRLVVITVDSADTSVRLDNACYRLANGATFGPFCDADDGNVDGRVIFTNVPAGEYTLTETVAPTGYETAGERTVTIPAGGSFQVTVANARIPLPEATGTLVVIPLDPNGSEVAGGCYQVFQGDTAVTNRLCDNADDQPRRIIFDNLPVGEYTVSERLAPSPDYVIADAMSVTIEEDTTSELRVPHQLKPGRLLVQAVNDTGLPLQGACFDVSDDGAEPYCTGATGEILVTDLAAGTRTLTQTQAPYGYKLNETPREITIRPGQTTVVRVLFEVEPPPNTGTVQVQKFVCPAGDEGERTMFLGGAQGNAQLRDTVGCAPAVAEFTLEPENGSESNSRQFATTTEGRYQVTVEEGIYVLTETNPDLEGNSAARLRVGVGQMTTVIVINYIEPPQPEPATVNVEAYTCPPSFNGTTYDDFAANCINDSSPTNQVTVRAEGESRFKQVTGDGGVIGVTTFDELPAGTYNIYAEKPFSVPLMYMFCGGNADYPADDKVINGTVRTELSNGEEVTCEVFLIPEQMSTETGAILVQKYSCPIDTPAKGYDFQDECSRSEEQVVFEIAVFNREMQDFEPLTQVTANPDGIVRFPDLRPGTYKLTEVDGQWCFAQSNSVNAEGNVVVQANKLAEVWVYNCVGTQEPPNTGSGSAAHLLNGEEPSTPVAAPVDPRKVD